MIKDPMGGGTIRDQRITISTQFLYFHVRAELQLQLIIKLPRVGGWLVGPFEK